MLTFDGTCPHCASDKGFNAFGLSCYIVGPRNYIKLPLTPQENLMKSAFETVGACVKPDLLVQATFSLAGECRKCHKPILATCSATRKDALAMYGCILSSKKTMTFPGVVEAIYPQPAPPYSHEALPEKVNEAFVGLQKMLVEGKPPYFIIMGCRTVLEAAVRELGGGKDGDKLYARIEDLFKKGKITDCLRDWATIIRKYGNGAAHEMNGTTEEARELVDFTKIFLQFTFELPATIRAMQGQ